MYDDCKIELGSKEADMTLRLSTLQKNPGGKNGTT